MKLGRLPYFDFLLHQLEARNPAFERSFGRHVHWGYWPDPAKARDDDEDFAGAAERLTLELCALADVADGQRVLDVGCGFGGTIAWLNERFDALSLVGLNIDARQIDRARRTVHPTGRNSIAFVAADACLLPLPDASVDRVLAVECVFHFPSRETFFAEAWRVLRPGGVLALSDFVPAPSFRPLCRLGAQSWFASGTGLGGCDVTCTLEGYRRLAAKSGLVVADERNATAHTLPTYGYIRALLRRHLGAGWRGHAFSGLLGLNSLLGKLALMNYYLLSFRKLG